MVSEDWFDEDKNVNDDMDDHMIIGIQERNKEKMDKLREIISKLNEELYINNYILNNRIYKRRILVGKSIIKSQSANDICDYIKSLRSEIERLNNIMSPYSEIYHKCKNILSNR